MKEVLMQQLVEKQRSFFRKGKTRQVSYRIDALKKLKETILSEEKKIVQALQTDLRKSASESYMCEIGMVLEELSFMIKHIGQYAAVRHVRTPMAQFLARSFQIPSPYGNVLVISPWNYPFLLSLGPLVDAIAAGNTVVLKPSAYAPATGEVLASLIRKCFDEEYVAVVLGGRAENTCLLQQKFDYIFFTGSKSVGKEVMRQAAEHLTPVTLELGGKSPCIVDKTADLKIAARRIVFGKYLNCGQTCVAPDYVYCHREVKEQFLAEVKAELQRQYGRQPLKNENYGKIINEKHFDRIRDLIEQDKVVVGGKCIEDELRIEPTVMHPVSWKDAVMQEEIFGPIMPVLTYSDLSEVITAINHYDHPLALYLFTEDKKVVKKVFRSCSFGGGCVNDTIIHLATTYMGFGGVGESGMGSYHGKAGFDTFTHYKSIVDKASGIDMPMRYQPYSTLKDSMVRRFLK